MDDIKQASNSGRSSLTNPSAKLILMSAPPGVASPGYMVTLNGRDKGMHYNTTYHIGGVKRLDKTLSA